MVQRESLNPLADPANDPVPATPSEFLYGLSYSINLPQKPYLYAILGLPLY